MQALVSATSYLEDVPPVTARREKAAPVQPLPQNSSTLAYHLPASPRTERTLSPSQHVLREASAIANGRISDQGRQPFPTAFNADPSWLTPLTSRRHSQPVSDLPSSQRTLNEDSNPLWWQRAAGPPSASSSSSPGSTESLVRPSPQTENVFVPADQPSPRLPFPPSGEPTFSEPRRRSRVPRASHHFPGEVNTVSTSSQGPTVTPQPSSSSNPDPLSEGPRSQDTQYLPTMYPAILPPSAAPDSTPPPVERAQHQTPSGYPTLQETSPPSLHFRPHQNGSYVTPMHVGHYRLHPSTHSVRTMDMPESYPAHLRHTSSPGRDEQSREIVAATAAAPRYNTIDRDDSESSAAPSQPMPMPPPHAYASMHAQPSSPDFPEASVPSAPPVEYDHASSLGRMHAAPAQQLPEPSAPPPPPKPLTMRKRFAKLAKAVFIKQSVRKQLTSGLNQNSNSKADAASGGDSPYMHALKGKDAWYPSSGETTTGERIGANRSSPNAPRALEKTMQQWGSNKVASGAAPGAVSAPHAANASGKATTFRARVHTMMKGAMPKSLTPAANVCHLLITVLLCIFIPEFYGSGISRVQVPLPMFTVKQCLVLARQLFPAVIYVHTHSTMMLNLLYRIQTMVWQAEACTAIQGKVQKGIAKTQSLLGMRPAAEDPAATATLLSLLRTHRASRHPQDLTVSALPQLSSVEFDGASNPPLTPPALRTLAPLLPILSAVALLDILDTAITTAGAQLLARYLPHMQSLRVVCFPPPCLPSTICPSFLTCYCTHACYTQAPYNFRY